MNVPGAKGFAAVAAVRYDVWAGGRHGLLYHSPDAGATWTAVPFPSSRDIVRIEFSNRREGEVTTTEGRTYQTHDGGESWTAAGQ
jgi:photosystem II stability/assembly factor-like uncharacterized protein